MLQITQNRLCPAFWIYKYDFRQICYRFTNKASYNLLLKIFYRDLDARKCPGCQANWLHEVPRIRNQRETMSMFIKVLKLLAVLKHLNKLYGQ